MMNVANAFRQRHRITASCLGSAHFKDDYHIKYAYLAGAMYKGIASKEMIVALGRSGLMGYFGTGGLAVSEIKAAVCHIKSELQHGQSYGMNLLCNLERPEIEQQVVDLYLEARIRYVEAAAFMEIRPSLVHYRIKGLRVTVDGNIDIGNRLLAKVSRPEVAAAFMEPPPELVLRRLVQTGRITASEAELGRRVPMADDICVEADSGGHTDQGVALALVPAILILRSEMMKKHNYAKEICVGVAGGIGTPEAAAAAFVLGADFILTGSINQCTVEAGTSAPVKDLLQEISVQDTAYVPAGDMFELGAKAQVVKRGLLFPARANKLYELYQRCDSIDDIDENTKRQIQERYFKRSFEQVWQETKAYYSATNPEKLDGIEKNPKMKMALIFKWYFMYTAKLAMQGDRDRKVDFQVHCGPALGAFNQWVKGTNLESWRNRHVAEIAERLMTGAANVLEAWFAKFDPVPPSVEPAMPAIRR